MENNGTKLFIAGDIARDYYLVKGKRFNSDDRNPNGTRFVELRGGAYLIFRFLEAISQNRKAIKAKDALDIRFLFDESVFDNLPDKNRAYATVAQFGNGSDSARETVLRIDEFLGFGNNSDIPVDFSKYYQGPDTGSNIFIIDDAGIDFSGNTNKPVWSALLESIKQATKQASNIKSPKTQDTLLIYKKSGKITSSDFLNTLIEASSEKAINLLTVVAISDIRKLDVKISAGLSWEQIALDIVSELRSNEILRLLRKSKFLVITFESAGALLVVNKDNNDFEYSLIFDPVNMEGDYLESGSGFMIGRKSFFTATLASAIDLTRRDKNYQLETAIKAGLTSIRLLSRFGYVACCDGIDYPFNMVASGLETMNDFSYSSAPVPAHLESKNNWSILMNNYSDKDSDSEVKLKSMKALAKNIVLKGHEILKNVPSGKFGNLFTIDRNEIESLRNLEKVMKQYVNNESAKKPLSIGVFGPPGAGKSFAVEEIGKDIMGDKYHILVFNLSQFNDPVDLIGALHQVRDCVLRKKIPIVFWDEFDSQGYKWLQYLLAPMQDGVFQEGQLTHPVGKCIFIFAGATSYSIESFGKFKTDEAKKDFILKKGPDFISRLHGYINILGPNRRQVFNQDYNSESEKWLDDPTDLIFPVRRALFIIGLLRLRKKDFPFKMDWGLLNAFITVDRYMYGSRSMSNLLNDILQNNPNKKLQRSWLPSKATLEMYFKNADEFYRCLESDTEYNEQVWDLAPIIHSFWYKKLENPTKEYNVDYSFLPVFIKESNVVAAKRIPIVLNEGGFAVTRKFSDEVLSVTEFISIIEKNDGIILNKMAKKEHDLWMEFYEENGWVYDENRNDYAKRHNNLLPYNELEEDDRKKDMFFIKMYPEILEKIGFGIVKI